MPSRSLTRGRPAVVLAALCLAGGLAGCGGGEEDGAAVLDRAFDAPVESADANVSIAFEVEGEQQGEGPVRAELAGPIEAGEGDAPPSLDWDVLLAGGEDEQLALGFISAGDEAFAEIAGEAYELGGGIPSLGLDARSWFVEPTVEGEEEVDGADTTHVSGSVDVEQMLVDLNEGLAAASESLEGDAPAGLTEQQRAELDEAIEGAEFDAYVDDDDIIRRLTASLNLTVPEQDRDQVQGVEGGVLTFSMELSNVGGDQQVEAPADARPFEELVTQLQGLQGVLGGGPAAPGGGAAAEPPPEQGAPESGAAPPPAGGELAPESGAAPPSSPQTQAFQEYSRCLAETDATDQAGLDECSELLE